MTNNTPLLYPDCYRAGRKAALSGFDVDTSMPWMFSDSFQGIAWIHGFESIMGKIDPLPRFFNPK